MKKVWKMPPALEQHKTTILAVMGILAMILLIVPGLFQSKEEEAAPALAPAEINMQEYSDKLTAKLTNILEGMEGVGEVKVLLTMEKGEEKIYATERQSGTNHRTSLTSDTQKSIESTADENEKYLLVRGQNGIEQPVLLRVMEPTVRGAVILCEGGASPGVRETVLSASKALLGIPTNRISVQKLSNGGN